ncbi:MAG: inositol monophosphatase [Actinobacteria bacterium]|nr:inositol monophosphatase [Actinomycetota bacterium]
MPADAQELATVALRVAVSAADLVRDRRAHGFGVDTKSTVTDMVTDVDRASDALIRELLTQARPHDGIVTEEDDDISGSTGIVWIADPIDGTTNFVYGHRPYQVAIAATVDGRPIAGAVVEVESNDRYHAALGAGSYRGCVRLRVPSAPPLERALVATGFGYSPERRSRQARVVAGIITDIRDIRRLGAAAFDLCSVAAGRVDAYYEHGLGPWDLAAGELIVTEAGGAVEGIDGGLPDAYRGIIAAHRDLLGPLRELLIANGALEVIDN